MSTADIKRTTLPTPAATARPVLSPVDGVPMADSRDVATFFGKTHRSVLLAIDTAIAAEPDLALHDLMQGSYTVPETGAQRHRRFLLTRDGFSLIAMGFTGPRALKWKRAYIAAFNAMEAELRARPAAPAFDPNDPASLRTMLLGYTEKLIEARAERDEARAEAAIAREEVLQAAPKVEAFEHLLDDTGTCNLANAARILGAEQRPFFTWLRKGGYVFDKGEALLPRADLRKDGRFKVRLLKIGRDRHVEQTLVTRQGLVWLSHRWAAKLARDAREAAAARIQGELGV